MNLLYHIIFKVFSGRWVWAVTSAGVFAFLACTGKLEPKDVMFVIGVVVGFYFNKQTEAALKKPEGEA